jgi:hypothetical protein
MKKAVAWMPRLFCCAEIDRAVPEAVSSRYCAPASASFLLVQPGLDLYRLSTGDFPRQILSIHGLSPPVSKRMSRPTLLRQGILTQENAMKNEQIIIRTSFTERLVFLTKPDVATRRKLSAEGFKWNGALWYRTRGTASTLRPKQLDAILTPDLSEVTESTPELATA